MAAPTRSKSAGGGVMSWRASSRSEVPDHQERRAMLDAIATVDQCHFAVRHILTVRGLPPGLRSQGKALGREMEEVYGKVVAAAEDYELFSRPGRIGVCERCRVPVGSEDDTRRRPLGAPWNSCPTCWAPDKPFDEWCVSFLHPGRLDEWERLILQARDKAVELCSRAEALLHGQSEHRETPVDAGVEGEPDDQLTETLF